MDPNSFNDFLNFCPDGRSDSPSLENLYSNKPVLERRLKYRLDRDDLVVRGLVPPHSTATIATQVAHLERAKTGDYLQRKIRVRPNRQQLVQRHILTDSHADASIQATQTTLERRRIADQLNEQLFNRPGPLELIRENILTPDNPVVSEKVKQGDVPFDPICNGLYLADSPNSEVEASPNHVNDHVDIFSEAFSQHVKVEPEILSGQTSPLGCDLDFRNVQSFQGNLDHNQKAINQGINALSKDIQSQRVINSKVLKKKQVNKVKVKKYKYHEYRPTGTKEIVDDAPTDEHYKKLLEQQTLYLQLQVMQQNALMEALQGNDDKDNMSSDVNEQECLRERASSSVSSSSSAYSPQASATSLEDMRVTDLRSLLKLRGLPVSGQKSKLIERLRSYDEMKSSSYNNETSMATASPISSIPQTVPSNTIRSDTSALQTAGCVSSSSTVMVSSPRDTNPNLVCVAPGNGLSYQVIQPMSQNEQFTTTPNTAAPLQNVMQQGQMINTCSNTQNRAQQYQFVASPPTSAQPPQFPQRQSSSPASLPSTNQSYPVQIINGNGQVLSNGVAADTGSTSHPVSISPMYSSFIGTIGGQQVIIHSLNPQQQQQQQQQLQQQQQQQIQLQQQQLQQQIHEQQQQTLRLSGSLPDLKHYQQQINNNTTQAQQQKSQPIMKLENKPWVKQPDVPVSDGSAFMMFTMIPEQKSCNNTTVNNQQQINSRTTTVTNKQPVIMSQMPMTQQPHQHFNGMTQMTNRQSSSSIVNNGMDCDIVNNLGTVTTHNGSHEDLLDILGELSPPSSNSPNRTMSTSAPMQTQSVDFSAPLRIPKTEPPTYTMACASLNNKNNSIPNIQQTNGAGSVPDSLNLFGMENKNSPLNDIMDESFRQRSESTPCKPISKRRNIQTPTPMNIDDDASNMDIDDFAVPNGGCDLQWLDLSFTSPSSSPHQKLYSNNLSLKDQLQQFSSLGDFNPNPNNLNSNLKLSNDQPVSIFDLDSSCGLLNDNCDMDRWDLY